MEKKTRKIEINNLIMPLFWAFILVLCVFILSSTAKAETSINVPLPYVVPDYVGLNNVCSLETIEAIYSGYFVPNVQPYYPNTDFTKAILYYQDAPNVNNEGYVSVVVLPSPVITTSMPNDTTYENWDLATGVINVQPTGRIFTMNLRLDRPINSMYGGSSQGDGTVNLFGQHATISNSYGNTTILYPFLMLGIDNLYDASGNYVIMTNEQQALPPSAVAPDFSFFQPQFPPMVTGPTIVPSFHSWTPYQWGTFTPPTFDDSSVINAIKSIGEMLGYGVVYVVSNIVNALNNIGNNLHTFFEDIIQTLQYYLGLIISNIQNAVQNIYENFKALIEPLTNKVIEFADLFIHPFDSEEFEEQIEDSSFFTNYHAIVDNCEVLTEIIEYAEERDHFSLYISFENPLDNSVHRIISSEISFDWLVPMRHIYRPFLWVCVLIELFVGGARVLTHALGGHGL